MVAVRYQVEAHMGLTIVVLLVIAVIAAVLALDILGLGWSLRKLWKYTRGRWLRH